MSLDGAKKPVLVYNRRVLQLRSQQGAPSRYGLISRRNIDAEKPLNDANSNRSGAFHLCWAKGRPAC